MESMPLSLKVLLGFLHQAIAGMGEPRKASNATLYSLRDPILGAFCAFFIQCESFLEHQRQMQSRQGKNNAQTLFGVIEIPSTPQMRNILDKLLAQQLFVVFTWVYQALQKGGYLTPFHCLDNHLLVTLDGTQYYSSSKLHCEKCSSRTHKTGAVTYSHVRLYLSLLLQGTLRSFP
jgi:hypothetical protein